MRQVISISDKLQEDKKIYYTIYYHFILILFSQVSLPMRRPVMPLDITPPPSDPQNGNPKLVRTNQLAARRNVKTKAVQNYGHR